MNRNFTTFSTFHFHHISLAKSTQLELKRESRLDTIVFQTVLALMAFKKIADFGNRDTSLYLSQ
jgi:uncharacterized membrane protein YobD (UPF0266 family)